MVVKMKTQPAEPLERSCTGTAPLTTQGVGTGSEDWTTHMKVEPPTKFTGKGLPTVCDWVEET